MRHPLWRPKEEGEAEVVLATKRQISASKPRVPLGQPHCVPCVQKASAEKKLTTIWAVGVTTVSSRRVVILPRTLESLKQGGFTVDRLFVDGVKDSSGWQDSFGIPATTRYPRIGAWGNWWLALTEMVVRRPEASRYAMFQDDVLLARNVRQYLDSLATSEVGYWNLGTTPRAMGVAAGRKGWFPSPQRGYGACGLVFGAAVAKALLKHPLLADHPRDVGAKGIDGEVVNAANKLRIREMCHNPSLLQHQDTDSTLGHSKYPAFAGWPGEDFDCTALIGRVNA